MTRWLLLLLLLALAACLVVLVLRLAREARQGRAARAGYFSRLVPILATIRSRREPSGFQRLAGRFEGHAFELQAMPDALAFRKLPALWLLVTLTEPQPLAGETRIMRRPTGHEPFSTFAGLPVEVALPPGFPERCLLRTTGPGALPPDEVLGGIAGFFADPRAKEVALSPAGLRVVWLAEEAARGGYLLFRDGELGRTPADPGPVIAAMRALADLSRSLPHA